MSLGPKRLDQFPVPAVITGNEYIGMQYGDKTLSAQLVQVANALGVLADAVTAPNLAADDGATLIGTILDETGAEPMTAAEAVSLRYNLWNFVDEAERADSETGAPTIDVSAKINNAIQRAAAKGRPLDGFGTWRVGAEKIVFSKDADFSKAKFIVYGAPAIAVEVSTGSSANPTDVLSNATIHLPYRIENATKPTTGWGGQGIGVRTVNTNSCRVYLGNIVGFAIGYQEASFGSNGNVYNDVFVGHLENNMVNLDLAPGEAASWVNENIHYGGRFSHYSAEGTNVAGTRHIRFNKAVNTVNNNLFAKPSIEGNVAEFHVENAGAYNTIQQGRWEAATPKLLYTGDNVNHGTRNMVFGGFGAQNIVVTYTGTTGGNNLHLYPGGSSEGASSGRRVVNDSSSDAAIDLYYEAGTRTDQPGASDWSVRHSSQYLRGKRKADVSERVRIDYSNGRVLLGNGTATPVAYIGNLGNTNLASSASWAPLTSGTLDLGLASFKWQHVFLTGAVGFFGATPLAAKPTVTGSRAGNVALASLITQLVSYGLIADSTTA